MGLVKTITLTIVVDEFEEERLPVVLGAIRGIMPTLNRVAGRTSVIVRDDEAETK